MREVCFCGWTGTLNERQLVYASDGEWALECPSCRRIDHLGWLPAHLRADVLGDAHRRQQVSVSFA
jgi:hypothetical protein